VANWPSALGVRISCRRPLIIGTSIRLGLGLRPTAPRLWRPQMIIDDRVARRWPAWPPADTPSRSSHSTFASPTASQLAAPRLLGATDQFYPPWPSACSDGADHPCD
jgi:hypothetical protein